MLMLAMYERGDRMRKTRLTHGVIVKGRCVSFVPEGVSWQCHWKEKIDGEGKKKQRIKTFCGKKWSLMAFSSPASFPSHCKILSVCKFRYALSTL
jgi:hypothetical protein